MLSSLLTWLDASPAHYGSAAWIAFAAVVAVAFAGFFSARARAWWRHPALFGALLLLAVLAFRWPALLDNRQLNDPDESQLMAGALTLRHDPLFWRSVDGTTHGPLAEWPLLVAPAVGHALDYTAARTISVLFVWLAVLAAWAAFHRLFGDGPARLLVLPLLATHTFTHFWNFVQFGSEHAPAALLAAGCGLLITAWDRSGQRVILWRLFLAGLALGAVPFAKIQSLPIAAWAAGCGIFFVLAAPGSPWPRRLLALATLALGGFAVPAALLWWIRAHDLWADFWQSYIVNNLNYTNVRWFTWAQGPATLVTLGRDAWGFNPFFLGSLAFSAAALFALPWFARWHRRCAVFALGLVLASVYAVLAPGRSFMHYLQLTLFPVGLLVGVLAGGALAAFTESSPFARLAPSRVRALWLALFLGCGLVPQIVWRAREPQPFLGRFAATHGQLAPSAVSREIRQHAQPGEALAIWGWMPVFWVETGLVQGTRDGNASRQLDPTPDAPFYRARFLADLRRNDPPVVLDAVGENNFSYHDRPIFGHENCDELRDLLASRYRLAADLDGTRIYVRLDRP